MQSKHFTHHVISIFLPISLFINVIPSYILNDNTLKVGVSKYAPPLSFIEEETTLKGFSVDLAKLLAANMESKIEIYAMNDSDLIRALNEGEIDLIIGIIDDDYSTTNMIRTPFHANRNYFINRQIEFESYKDLPGQTLAIEKGRTLSWLLAPESSLNYIETESQEEALALLDSGKAQVYISNNSLSTEYIINKKGFRNIKEVEMPLETVPMVLVVNKNKPELLTTLSMAYGKILEDKSYESIYIKWFGNDASILLGKYRKNIAVVVLFVILVILVFIFWNFTLKRRVNQITEDLRISEQKYRELFDTSPEMICLISVNGEIRLVNNVTLTHLGFNEKEIKRFRLHDLVVPRQTKEVTEFINHVVQNKYSNKEFIFKKKNGIGIHVEMVATIIKGFDDIDVFLCCFARDITERKNLEENLIRSDRLSIMGQMAAGIAHEINNPLGIILNNAQEVLYHELTSEDSRQSLKSIEKNAHRAAKIISNMLNFTRPMPLHLSQVELPSLIDGILLFLKQKLKQKNIRVEKNYPADQALFRGDENLIHQLLINVILNAIQSIKQEGVIDIVVKSTGEDGDKKLILEIGDNGIGIPEEDLQNIFNPFFTSRKENGFGLGLFISRMIVEKHYGSIFARSTVGKGTVMTIQFPIDSVASNASN